ncbi:hypothetical protein KC326_g149 [Hortaea werneckii]|nr:hypothetical protein KC326_g149 [Hortaea werneckii]
MEAMRRAVTTASLLHSLFSSSIVYPCGDLEPAQQTSDDRTRVHEMLRRYCNIDRETHISGKQVLVRLCPARLE